MNLSNIEITSALSWDTRLGGPAWRCFITSSFIVVFTLFIHSICFELFPGQKFGFSKAFTVGSLAALEHCGVLRAEVDRDVTLLSAESLSVGQDASSGEIGSPQVSQLNTYISVDKLGSVH